MKHLFILFLMMGTVAAVAQGNSYTIVFLNKKAEANKLSPEETKTIMDGHMANMQRLAAENKLLIAGPFDGGGGIFVMNTANPDEVKEWISTDPGVKAQRWNIEILPFKPRYGSVCPVGEQYEMTHYSFVRFDAIVSKFTASNHAELMGQHDKYLKEIIAGGNVISEAIFGTHDGGILILKGEVDPELIASDPAVKHGLVDVQNKKLYIAKGSFCEK